MSFDDRFAVLRAHTARRHQCDWVQFERDIDRLEADVRHEAARNEARFEQLQDELAELLARTPAADNVPASVTVTVH